MSGVATAVVGSALVSAGASYMGKRSNDKAINAANLQDYTALQQQKELADREWNASAPWRAEGQNALFERRRWMENPELSPITRLYMNEGKNALSKSLASRGLAGSGAGLEAESGMLQKYLAEDKAQRLNALNALTAYVPPGGGDRLSMAIGQYGNNTENNMLRAGQNRANFYNKMGDTLTGAGGDMMKMYGYGGFSRGSSGGGSGMGYGRVPQL